MVVDGWFEVVGRGGVFGSVHSDGDGEVDGMVTVVCGRSVFKMCVEEA